jgi:hypothetical protein
LYKELEEEEMIKWLKEWGWFYFKIYVQAVALVIGGLLVWTLITAGL